MAPTRTNAVASSSASSLSPIVRDGTNEHINEKPKPRPKPKATRSRNGCLVCRSRRLKCDLEKPECKRCVNYGAECVYPEKKPFNPNTVAEKLARRHNTRKRDEDGQSLPPKNDIQDPIEGLPNNANTTIPNVNPYPSQTSFSLPTTPVPILPHPSSTSLPSSSAQSIWIPHPTQLVQQMDSVELLMALCRDTRMGQFFGGPLDPPEFLRSMFPVEEDLRCFHHALTYSLSILVVEEEPNPWVEHVARLFLVPSGEAPLSTEALKQGMLAMGAIHLSVLEARGSMTSSPGRTRELGLAYRGEAVKLLRQAKNIPEEIASDAFLACAVILSCDDVLGANPHWREVIRLGLLAVQKRGGCERILFPDKPYPDNTPIPDKPVSPLLRCLIETMTIGDVGRSLSTGDPTVVLTDSSTWWERLAPVDPSEHDSCEGTWGMHRTIPRLMTRVINLTYESAELDRQSFFDFPDQTCIHPPSDNHLALQWLEEKKRWGESLTIRINELRHDMANWILTVPQNITRKRTKDGSLATWHAFQILILRDLLKLPREDEGIQKSADTVLEICSQVGDKVEWMNFSILITCTALISQSQRQKAREVLRWFRVQCCYEIDVLESVAEECWKRIDDGLDDEACSWREILLEMGCSVLLG
ncbi:hypothetical protein I302_100604 [Kwoniella bestiolae CBS 10118]|uniref:Zn(2)-C6 fungal-type domain-containing protein n=1 Tax=Kwoniella bestiolae CBS 10118 TaxID=1296100 RepID=A0A1B9G5J2_9TREE|nr:hypothetical protein I302_03978 [Kwoniella bestiolae CBS 10118]OCF26295.1 hypothetical protein I302_03978 [Kwoniella bestiolae CBS 10118]